jgi:hypothetical protein
MAKRTEDWDSDCEVQDGETVHVPMLCDGTQYHFAEKRVNVTDAEQRQRRMFRDALAKHQPLAATHGPSYCDARLKWSVADDVLSISLQDAIATRQKIFDQESKRRDELWRGGPATMPVGDKLPDHPDEDNGDDDDQDEGGDEDNDTGDDADSLKQAMAESDQAYLDQYRREPWRDMNGGSYGARPLQPLDPGAADRTQAQAFAWRHGR